MMNRTMPYRLIVCAVVVIFTAATMNVYGQQPGRSAEELRNDAFIRGGSAISQALTQPKPTEILVSANFVPPLPPSIRPPAPPQEGKQRRVMLWVGIGVTAAIAGYLIQRSVRNHNSIFTPRT